MGGGISVASLLLIHIISEQNFSISVVCHTSLTQHLHTSDLLTVSLLSVCIVLFCSAFSMSAHRFHPPSIFPGILCFSVHLNISACSVLTTLWWSPIYTFLSFQMSFFNSQHEPVENICNTVALWAKLHSTQISETAYTVSH